MKKRLSVLYPLIRTTALPLTALLILLSGTEYYFFSQKISDALDASYFTSESMRFVATFDDILLYSNLSFIFQIAFGFLAVLLALCCLNRSGGNINYTIRRLSVSEREVHILWGAYYSLCYFVLCVWQLITIYGLYRIYLASPLGAYDGGMTFFLASYRVPLLHSLMPLSDMTRHVCNLILLGSLGLCHTIFSYRLRKGQKPMALFVVFWLAAFFFSGRTASFGHDAFLSVALIITDLSALFNIWGEQHDE